MCGIAGFWGPSGQSFDSQAVLTAMSGAMEHRGPDANGVMDRPDLGLGLAHVRLSILDLSPAGAQPMHSHSGRLSCVYNGEIYNYMQIRTELEAQGHAPQGGWSGHSDTEVVLEAVEAWGLEATLKRCIGMFAIALWDNADNSLTLIRDRLGIKPLYYGFAGPSLLFGSEFKPLRRHPHWQGAISRDVLALYLRTLYVPDPFSIYEGIHKLEPGSILRLHTSDISKGTLPAATRYWSVNDAAAHALASPFTGTQAQAVDALESLLTDAVRLRTIADVPLGSFLSGGIDSSTITALLQKVSPHPVKTFTIGFEEQVYDEVPHAEAVAAHLGTDHTTLRVTPAQTLDVIPKLAHFYDEPFADASQIPTYLVSQLARQQVTVSLSGDGGDELFGGYNRYLLAPRLWNKLDALPLALRRGLSSALGDRTTRAISAIYNAVSRITNPTSRQLIFQDKLQKLTASMAASSREEFFHNLASYWITPEAFIPGATPPKTRFTDPSQWPPFNDYETWMMAMDMQTYLPGDILTKVDRASMAVSLEARVPILDHRVVEFALSLPLSMKIKNGQSKWLLRQVLHRHVPEQTFERPKQGFGIPIDDWLRGPLQGWADGLLAPDRLRDEGFFDPGPIRRCFEDHVAGRRNWHYHLWGVLMFQAWLEGADA